MNDLIDTDPENWQIRQYFLKAKDIVTYIKTVNDTKSEKIKPQVIRNVYMYGSDSKIYNKKFDKILLD